MAERRDIVLFHSVLGLRPAVHEWADRLRKEGHVVHTPDLYLDGTLFEDMDQALRYRDEIGLPTLIERAQEAVAELPEDLIYMGFSMGASAAEFLAASRPGARAAVLLHAALTLEGIGAAQWPAGVPVAVHYMEDDHWVDRSEADQLGEAVRASGALFELFTYPGSGHLFADRDDPDYDAIAAELMYGRVVDFLART